MPTLRSLLSFIWRLTHPRFAARFLLMRFTYQQYPFYSSYAHSKPRIIISALPSGANSAHVESLLSSHASLPSSRWSFDANARAPSSVLLRTTNPKTLSYQGIHGPPFSSLGFRIHSFTFYSSLHLSQTYTLRPLILIPLTTLLFQPLSTTPQLPHRFFTLIFLAILFSTPRTYDYFSDYLSSHSTSVDAMSACTSFSESWFVFVFSCFDNFANWALARSRRFIALLAFEHYLYSFFAHNQAPDKISTLQILQSRFFFVRFFFPNSLFISHPCGETLHITNITEKNYACAGVRT